MKNICVQKQSEMVLGKNRPCCYFCDINLPCILFSNFQVANCSTRCHELEIIIMSQDRASNLKTVEQLHGILQVDLQKAKDNIKNKIEGYPRIEQGNISLFSFCKQFWNIRTHWENLTAKTSSSEQHSAFREL